MKAHIGVEAASGLVHTVTTTAANVADVTKVGHLLHREEASVHADAGYRGAEKRAPKPGRAWHIAAKRGSIKAMPDGEESTASAKRSRDARTSAPISSTHGIGSASESIASLHIRASSVGRINEQLLRRTGRRRFKPERADGAILASIHRA